MCNYMDVCSANGPGCPQIKTEAYQLCLVPYDKAPKERASSGQSEFAGSLRSAIVKGIALEQNDVDVAEGYTDTYKVGIREGMRLALLIFDEEAAKH